MNIQTAWDSLAAAVAAMHQPEGDYQLKLATVAAAVELLYEFPPEQILEQVEASSLPTRATVSWLVFEGRRMRKVTPSAVETLAVLYEDGAPPGQGLIAPPTTWAGQGNC